MKQLNKKTNYASFEYFIELTLKESPASNHNREISLLIIEEPKYLSHAY